MTNRTTMLTLSDAAEVLNVSVDTVRREISRGNLPAVRIGRQLRIRPADLDAAYGDVTSAKAVA